MDFDAVWKGSVRFRRVSRELEPLLRELHAALSARGETEVLEALEAVLVLLTSDDGRTDANCSVTGRFVAAIEGEWEGATPPLRGILDDISGTLHDAIYAPRIATTFQATPEQLLERVRRLRSP